MEWSPSRRHRDLPGWRYCQRQDEEEASREQVIIIGIDLAKNSFQLHGARADGSVAFRKKVSRAKLLDFVAEQPRGGRVVPRAGPSHGLQGQAATDTLVHFYAAAPVHFYAVVDSIIEMAG